LFSISKLFCVLLVTKATWMLAGTFHLISCVLSPVSWPVHSTGAVLSGWPGRAGPHTWVWGVQHSRYWGASLSDGWRWLNLICRVHSSYALNSLERTKRSHDCRLRGPSNTREPK
jgi:hypothetical protein